MMFLFVSSQLCTRASSPQFLADLQLPSASSYTVYKYKQVDLLQRTFTSLVHAHAGRTKPLKQDKKQFAVFVPQTL